MKHLTQRQRKKKPVWILYVLATVALVLAVVSLVRTIDKLGLISKPDLSEPSSITAGTSSDTSGGQSTTPSGGDATTMPPAEADAARRELLDECRLMLAGYYYDEAIERLESCGALENDETDALLAEARALKDGLKLYTGQLYHVFFHSLVIDPAKAFDGDGMANGYNMYMTTVYEFNKMLPLFLEGDFILYPITEMVEFKDGKAVQKPVYLPEGKKPLVISIDDVNYYDYMRLDGFALRLDVDKDGNVVTVTKGDYDAYTETYDGDVMPIVDAFVREHPEFSWRGAKGIVALTGYQGAFGYRITDLEDYDKETQKFMLDKVQEVAQALRNTGWLIASHSYTHNQYWNYKTITQTELEYDTGRWLNEIGPYVGGSDIFISPFGVSFDQNHFVFRYLVDHGFQIYCPVGSEMSTSWQNDNMVQSRLNLDGITMIKYPERVSKYFFDPALVLDPARPPLK